MNLAEAPVGGFAFDSQGRLAFQNGTDWAACQWVHAVIVSLFTMLIVARISKRVLEGSVL